MLTTTTAHAQRGFPVVRPRRLRRTNTMRRLVRETRLSVDQLVYPLFVVPGMDVRAEIPSMPGVFHWSVDLVTEEARAVADLGVPALLLFGLPRSKDAEGSEAWAPDGVVQQALASIKRAVPLLVLIADTCLCEYTSHGHCGLPGAPGREAVIQNDPSLGLLARTAVSQAEAGADVVAPSDMLDGRVGAIRSALDDVSLSDVAVLAYSAKYASAFYGPFREAVDSALVGDRRTYQQDPANRTEALREVSLDVAEGADLVIVKPAIGYLDVVADVAASIEVPVAAYQVSGEYAMIEAAAANGWIDRDRAIAETVTSIRRAGAQIVLTYWATELARTLTSGGA